MLFVMKNTRTYIKYPLVAALALGFFTACEPTLELETPSSGQADFSRYVALGNSLTAGYADNALYREGQVNSYPAILASLMQVANPSLTFNQPLLPIGGGLGFSGGNLVGKLNLTGLNPDGSPQIVPTSASEGALSPVQGPFQNLGVPGAKVGDLTMVGYGSSQGNPYFARFASSPAATLVGEAVAQNPTFFTLWIGNNDVLGYATTGGTLPITDAATFETQYRAIINELTTGNPAIEGAIANIANIEDIPYFNIVPWNAFSLTAEEAAQLNAGFAAQINPGVRMQIQTIVFNNAKEQAMAQGASEEQANQIAQNYVDSEEGQTQISSITNQHITQLKSMKYIPEFVAGANGFAVEDELSPTGIRQLVQGEKITFTFLTGGIAAQLPSLNYIVPDQYALDAGEQAYIRQTIDAYNQVIAAVAAENTFALVDMNAFFAQIVGSGGLTMGGTRFTNAFILGNAFSLDGVHLTQKGYALVARRFAEQINAYYNANLPMPNLDRYPAVIFPN
jgi:lysophospholipase L1-like esterase